MKYYQKHDWKVGFMQSNGSWIKFEQAGSHGILQTSDQSLIREFRIATENQRGGVHEITEQEYQDLKKNSSRKRWNPEAMSRKMLNFFLKTGDLLRKRGKGAVVEGEKQRSELPTPPGVSEFRPVSVKR